MLAGFSHFICEGRARSETRGRGEEVRLKKRGLGCRAFSCVAPMPHIRSVSLFHERSSCKVHFGKPSHLMSPRPEDSTDFKDNVSCLTIPFLRNLLWNCQNCRLIPGWAVHSLATEWLLIMDIYEKYQHKQRRTHTHTVHT